MRASIDIGSNSLLLLVQDHEGRTVCDELAIVGLGRGLGDEGYFEPSRRAHAAEVLRRFAALARHHGVPPSKVRAAATSAARRAIDAPEFFADVAVDTGLEVEVISGPEEARLSFLGAGVGLELGDAMMGMVDLGGGSTELAVGRSGVLAQRCSLELGSVRLTEAFLASHPDVVPAAALAPLDAHIATTLATLPIRMEVTCLVAVAGTATTLAAMELGLDQWDRDIVHGARLPYTALEAWSARLATSSAEERRQLAAVAPARAPYLLAGTRVLSALCSVLGRDHLLISDGGLRHGLCST